MTAASLQEIICCVGHPVAANPTQYVIEQALVAAGLDFRCLTFDVHPDLLRDAVAGMRAMGFLGAIFAHPHQVKIGQYLDEVEPIAQQASYIDFVIRVDDKLCGQSTLAAAVAELLTKLERMPKSAVVFGGAAREQLIAAQLVDMGISTTLVDTTELGQTTNDDPRGDSQEDAVQAGADATFAGSGAECDKHAAEDRGGDPHHPLEDAPTLAGKVGVPEASGHQPEPARCQLVTQADYESAPRPAELVIAASVEIKPAMIAAALHADASVVMDLTDEPVYTDFLRQAKGAGRVVFNSVDVRLASLVIAFRRWTNMEPDDSIMRDALEEFLLV